MTEQTYTVVGMTCAHCAQSVTEEIGGLSGVTDVAVDLPTGTVTVHSAAELDRSDVRDAITEAGYELSA